MRALVFGLFLALACSVQAQFEPAQPRDTGEAEVPGTLPEGVGLPPGTQAPDVGLQSIHDRPVALSGLWQQQPILLVFYRGGWCPYCNGQIRELTNAYPQFEAAGVLPVLVSVDKPDATLALSASYEIPFPVLSDSGMDALEAYNVVLQLDDETAERYKGFGIDLEVWSGEDHHAIAVASAFLIDQDGVIRWSHADLDYQRRPSSMQLLSAIEQIQL